MILALLGCGGPPPELDCPEGAALRVEQDGEARLVGCVRADGTLHGPRKRSLHGTPLWEEHYADGKLDGRRDLYDRGLRVSEVTYAAGLREGSALGRHPSGELMYEGAFVSDLASGEWLFYASDRALPVARVVFEAGRPMAVDGAPVATISVPLAELEVAGDQVRVGDDALTGPIPWLNGALLTEGTCPELASLELAVWTAKDRIVGLRGCGEGGCTRWAVTPPFAAAGDLVLQCGGS